MYNDMISGVINDIYTINGVTSIVLTKPDGSDHIFHIGDHTIILTFKNLEIGDTVDVIFNGIMTMSIPPQSTASIINGLKI